MDSKETVLRQAERESGCVCVCVCERDRRWREKCGVVTLNGEQRHRENKRFN